MATLPKVGRQHHRDHEQSDAELTRDIPRLSVINCQRIEELLKNVLWAACSGARCNKFHIPTASDAGSRKTHAYCLCPTKAVRCLLSPRSHPCGISLPRC